MALNLLQIYEKVIVSAFALCVCKLKTFRKTLSLTYNFKNGSFLRFVVSLTLALAATWLMLSGYFKPMLLTLGVISIATVIGLCHRMKIIDFETAPYQTTVRSIRYFAWLFIEIVKANMQVVKAVLNVNLEISPTLVCVPMPQTTDIGRTIFANSITLTPGTVSVDMEDDEILVHALLSEMSDPDDFKEMGERAAWSVGETHIPLENKVK